MKVVIFGTGGYYQKRRDNFINNVEIVGFLDNNSTLWGNSFENSFIFSPISILELEFDYIVLMSLKMGEMKRQLKKIGVDSNKIISYEQFIGLRKKGKLEIWFNKNEVEKEAESVLVIIPEFRNVGITVVGINLALELKQKGYKVTILASIGEQSIIDKIYGEGINVILYGNLVFANISELLWIKSFKFVIVNSFHLINCVYQIQNLSNVIWWLHESGDIYKEILEMHEKLDLKRIRNIDIYAVSEVAKKCCNKYYFNKNINILHYGIPEMNVNEGVRVNNKLIFAIIGYVNEIKGQDFFVEAIKLLRTKRETEFWIIGQTGENGFSKKIKEMAAFNSNIKFWGEVNRENIQQIYEEIDVVVGPSRNDAFPTVIVEGMMNEKVCITSEVTGLASYIENGKNGFICKKEDIIDLAAKMQWIIDNEDKLSQIRVAARQTYEKNFTMDILGNNVERILRNIRD